MSPRRPTRRSTRPASTTITPSATNPALAKNGWKTFFRALGNDASQGPAAAKYIKDDLKATKVFVIDDASEYGKGLADIVKSDLGASVIGTDRVQQKQTDFSASVTKVKASGAHGPLLRWLLRRGRPAGQAAEGRRLEGHHGRR